MDLIFDDFLDFISLRFLASFFGPIAGWFRGANVFIWVSTGWSCRQVRKLMEKNNINAWGYFEKVEELDRFIVFHVAKSDEEKCRELVERCIPRYLIN